MKNEQLLTILFQEGIIHEIIQNVGCAAQENPENLKDLEQDIYMVLLQSDNEKLNTIFENGQIRFYIANIVKTNIKSKTSRYYYLYKKDRVDSKSTCVLNEN